MSNTSQGRLCLGLRRRRRSDGLRRIHDLACTWPRAGCTACSMCEDTILGLETTARYRPENPYQPARRQWGWRQAPPSAIPSDRSHLEGHGLAPASSKSVAVGCSWSATSRGRWANRCQGRSEALAGRSSIAETASMEEHLCAVAHGPAVPKSTGCKHWEAISVHTCACVV